MGLVLKKKSAVNETDKCKSAEEYDRDADFSGSIDECYRAIRERVKAGGPGWPSTPPTSQE